MTNLLMGCLTHWNKVAIPFSECTTTLGNSIMDRWRCLTPSPLLLRRGSWKKLRLKKRSYKVVVFLRTDKRSLTKSDTEVSFRVIPPGPRVSGRSCIDWKGFMFPTWRLDMKTKKHFDEKPSCIVHENLRERTSVLGPCHVLKSRHFE